MLYFILFSIFVVSCLLISFYIYITYNYDYWKKRNVPFIKPSFPFGNFGDVMMGRKSFIDLTKEQYRAFEGERFFGVFDFGTPILVIRDPALVERILITDFPTFCNKRFDSSSINDEFLSYTLSGMQDNVWRTFRLKLNPAFSSNKVKQLFDNISLGADELVAKIRECKSKNEEVSAISLASVFSYKVIASSFFGFECSSSASDLLMTTAKKTLFKINILDLIFVACFYVPKLVNLLYYIPSVHKVLKFYKDLSLAAVETRKEARVKRNDVLQIMLDLKTEKEVKSNHDDHSPLRETEKDSDLLRKHQLLNDSLKNDTGLSDGFIIAQLFSFMSIGANILTSSLSVVLADLASKPTIQRKVQAEMDEVLNKFGQIDINFLQNLKYLDAVIQESLRLNPGYVGPVRSCSAPYTLPGTDLVLERGTSVMIPTCAIHRDPNNYPDPELYIPERFTDNHFKPSSTYLPFGAGPRICLVYRLVTLMLKVAVAKVMCEYSLTMGPKARMPVRYKPSFMGKLEDQLWLKFEPRIPSTP